MRGVDCVSEFFVRENILKMSIMKSVPVIMTIEDVGSEINNCFLPRAVNIL